MAGTEPATKAPELREEDSVDVGARLRSVRLMRGWSQRELAKRAGVTNATISLIEQGRVSPSVGSLKKVLDSIPMSLAEFFSLQLDDSPSVFFRAEDMPDVGTGAVGHRLLAAGHSNREMSILYETYPPGGDTGPEMLSHSGEEGGIVVSGQLEVTVGAEVAVLGPGDGYYFSSRRPHRFRNPGDCDCILVSANTPPCV
ncbi:cupin domain-containing protein [Microbulbifer yueqingensis]|uniref:Transcriptional regulator, XRE family with cupin sensor n=1 Tax=Microbulbifer yueqingensis TaxID=658219 RepID=A0A1G9AI87_9GAMM|nr:cupin domain-containing protein [Microbulbifer yueqingensis]SDK26534.1 transcriptional regulator, XRE family with cupin sensor [Microbulbifer yueqingensis]